MTHPGHSVLRTKIPNVKRRRALVVALCEARDPLEMDTILFVRGLTPHTFNESEVSEIKAFIAEI